MRAAAVVVAGGRGRRAGGGTPKQFRDLGGRRVVEWACRPLRRSEAVELVVLVVPRGVAEATPAWLGPVADVIVAGGPTRRESVARGVEAVPEDAERILVHDGVRPFAGDGLVSRVLEGAGRGPVVPVLPVADTLKEVEDGRVVRTLDRARIRRVQTPQGFPAALLRRVHAEPPAGDVAPTDDASLCEAAGSTVRTVEGDPLNLKLTTREDFAYAAWLLRRGEVPRA